MNFPNAFLRSKYANLILFQDFEFQFLNFPTDWNLIGNATKQICRFVVLPDILFQTHDGSLP